MKLKSFSPEELAILYACLMIRAKSLRDDGHIKNVDYTPYAMQCEGLANKIMMHIDPNIVKIDFTEVKQH